MKHETDLQRAKRWLQRPTQGFRSNNEDDDIQYPRRY
jgi:hypothetical protein